MYDTNAAVKQKTNRIYLIVLPPKNTLIHEMYNNNFEKLNKRDK